MKIKLRLKATVCKFLEQCANCRQWPVQLSIWRPETNFTTEISSNSLHGIGNETCFDLIIPPLPKICLSLGSFYYTLQDLFRQSFISLLSLFLKNKSRLMRSPCCLCVFPSINFWMPEPIFMKIGMYIVTPDIISTEYFINPSHQSVSICVYPPSVARQRLGKNVTWQRIQTQQ
jgi:hypothetical protein